VWGKLYKGLDCSGRSVRSKPMLLKDSNGSIPPINKVSMNAKNLIVLTDESKLYVFGESIERQGHDWL